MTIALYIYSLEAVIRPYHIVSEGDTKQVAECRRELISAKWRKPGTLMTSCGFGLIQVRHFGDLGNSEK